MWIWSYITGNFGLIAVVAALVIALGAVAWFARNWKVAVAALVVLGGGFAYMQIDKNAYQRRVAEEHAAQVKQLHDQIAKRDAAAEADAKRAQQDADEIAKLKELANATPANNSACLDRAAADRVRSIR